MRLFRQRCAVFADCADLLGCDAAVSVLPADFGTQAAGTASQPLPVNWLDGSFLYFYPLYLWPLYWLPIHPELCGCVWYSFGSKDLSDPNAVQLSVECDDNCDGDSIIVLGDLQEMAGHSGLVHRLYLFIFHQRPEVAVLSADFDFGLFDLLPRMDAALGRRVSGAVLHGWPCGR